MRWNRGLTRLLIVFTLILILVELVLSIINQKLYYNGLYAIIAGAIWVIYLILRLCIIPITIWVINGFSSNSNQHIRPKVYAYCAAILIIFGMVSIYYIQYNRSREAHRGVNNEIQLAEMRRLAALANYYKERGLHEMREDPLRQALIISDNVYGGAESFYSAHYLVELGDTYLEMNRTIEAAESFTRALEIQEKRSPDLRGVAESLVGLGRVNIALGNPVNAEDYLKRALSIIRSNSLSTSMSSFVPLIWLARAYEARGMYVQSESSFLEALTIYKNTYVKGEISDKQATIMAMILRELASVSRLAGHEAAANDHEEHARQILGDK